MDKILKVNSNNTKRMKIGNLYIGGGSKIAIQSMLNAPSHDIQKNLLQAKSLQDAGCDIVRVAIPDKEAIKLIPAIKSFINIPLVADIHFDYNLAIESAMAGADKIRINPGNIGSDDRVKQVVSACKQKNIPIRIGVNGGSLDKDILKKYNKICPEAMIESAINNIRLLEKFDFEDIVVSIKSSSVVDTVKVYRMISREIYYPLHLGVTEAGTIKSGIIKSSIGIGSLLIDNIGDTIRVSLTDDPVQEVYVAKNILKSIGLCESGVQVISCPTCGRTRIDIIKLSTEIERALEKVDKNITVAIMGCAVNGPGEAGDADIGIAGGDKCAIIFKKGKILRKIPEENILQELLLEIDSL